MTQSTIKSITRLQNSKDVNPRYHIEMEDGTKGATQSNVAWAYDIIPSIWEGKHCTYEIKQYKSGYRVFGDIKL